MADEADRLADSGNNQFLTFRLEKEIFAVPIDSVREVLDFVTVTRVPGAASFLSGVINLRGAVVPVADIRVRFGMDSTVRTENTCIIVVDVKAGEGMITIGLLADQVMEVADLQGQDLQDHPAMGTGIPEGFLHGIGKYGDGFFMILNIDAIVLEKDEEASPGAVAMLDADRSAVQNLTEQ